MASRPYLRDVCSTQMMRAATAWSTHRILEVHWTLVLTQELNNWEVSTGSWKGRESSIKKIKINTTPAQTSPDVIKRTKSIKTALLFRNGLM